MIHMLSYIGPRIRNHRLHRFIHELHELNTNFTNYNTNLLYFKLICPKFISIPNFNPDAFR